MDFNMTKQEMLVSVEAQIRKDIPRLMELREGCKFHSGYGVETIVCIKGDREDIFIFKDLFSNVYEANEIPQHYKIIGHDIMLNDVLEWVDKRQFFIDDLCIDIDGCFSLLDMVSRTFKCLKIDWNLPSPYLKDQSEVLIKFLYDLKQKVDE